MNILYNICLIIFIIFIIFYILNKYVLKKSYELFNTTSSGLLCGTNNDVCRVNQNGISSCCNGYTCIRKEGNFQYKVCIDNDKLDGSKLPKIGIDISNDINNIKIKIDNIIFPRSPSLPDLDDFLYTTDDEIINNIINYLNKLNINNNLLIFNLKEYLYGLLLTSEEYNYDFNDLYTYISNLKLNHFDKNILINIKNYLNGLNIPSNSILVELKEYLYGLNLPNILDLKYELSNYVLLNYYIINNILNYLNTLNLSNDSNYIKLKNELENLKKLIELNFNNNIDITKLNDYLNILNYFKLQDNITIGDLMNFLNSINIQNNINKQNIIDFKNYINSLNLPNNFTISQLKINLNNYINTINSLNLQNNMTIRELKIYLNSININDKINPNLFDLKNYINSLSLQDNILVTQLNINLKEYLNIINNLNLLDDMSLGNLRIYLNALNIKNNKYAIDSISITNLQNYIKSLKLSYDSTLSQLKININNNINNLINQYVSYFENSKSLLENLNIPELSNISYIIIIKDYLNSLKISDDILLSKLLNKLNNIDLSKIGENIGLGNLDFVERGFDIFGNYLKDFSICKI